MLSGPFEIKRQNQLMDFAASAMLFVLMAEMILEARRRIEHGSATPALMVGLAFMMFLDVSLG